MSTARELKETAGGSEARTDYHIPVPPGGRDLPPDSRIYLLARIEDRKFSLWGPMPHPAESKVLLAMAADALPPAYPQNPEETEAALIFKRAVSCPAVLLSASL